MSEIKPKSFRIDDETAEKFKEISNCIGGNQQEALAKLIEAFEFQAGKATLIEKKVDIEQFEKYTNALTRMFMNTLEDNQNITETVRTEFEAQLKSKDTVIQDLQQKLKEIMQSSKESDISLDSLKNGNMILQQELADLKLQHKEQYNNFESMIKDKDDLNSALTISCNSLNKELDALQEIQKEVEILKKQDQELREQNKALGEKISMLSTELEINNKQNELERDKLQLSLEKRYHEEKQNEVDKYQQKYLELLESLKKPSSTTKKPVSKTTTTKEEK